MKRTTALLGLALATLPLGACVDDGYRGGGVISVGYPYAGWYDGYYGSIYDGYWGSDNYFYYRLTPQDRAYRRDLRYHFRRDGTRPSPTYRRFEGTLRSPPQGTRMPRFPRDQRPDYRPDRDKDQDRDRDYNRDRDRDHRN